MTKAEAAQIRSDIFDLYIHVGQNKNNDYSLNHPRGTTLRVFVKALPPLEGGFGPENFEALEKLVSWVRFNMRWHAEVRDLTPDEQRVSDAAERVAAALPPGPYR